MKFIAKDNSDGEGGGGGTMNVGGGGGILSVNFLGLASSSPYENSTVSQSKCPKSGVFGHFLVSESLDFFDSVYYERHQ